MSKQQQEVEDLPQIHSPTSGKVIHFPFAQKQMSMALQDRRLRLFFTAAILGILAGEIIWYLPRMKEVQQRDCDTSKTLMERWPLSKEGMDWMAWGHEKTMSFIWMQLAFLLAYLVDFNMGSEMYLMVVLGHITKNFMKSFIRSPRGFWYCTEGFGIHCERGFSLPSGHSMMSIIVSLFLLYKFRSWPLFFVLVLLEIYMIFSIIYLGTHTIMDTVVGFTSGFAFFGIYLCNEQRFQVDKKNYNKEKKKIPAELLVILMAIFTGFIFVLERYEKELDGHPYKASLLTPEERTAFQTYCKIDDTTVDLRLDNSSAYEKTFLMLGITLALYVRSRMRLHGFLDGTTSVTKRVLRTAIGFYIFYYSKSMIKSVFTTLFSQETLQETAFSWLPYAHYFFQPVWVMAIYPIILHGFLLGSFFGIDVKSRKID